MADLSSEYSPYFSPQMLTSGSRVTNSFFANTISLSNSLDAKEINICAAFKLEQKTGEFAGNHCKGPRGCHCSDRHGLDLRPMHRS